MVEKSGCGQGGPLPIVPPSVGEQLEARMEGFATKEEVNQAIIDAVTAACTWGEF